MAGAQVIYIWGFGLGLLCAAAGHAVDTSVARCMRVFSGFCLRPGYAGI